MMQKNETYGGRPHNVHAARDGLDRTLNLDALRSFVAICDCGSFRRAAVQVHKSPSAVSLHVAKLEELLGAQVLERDARKVALTRQGELLLKQARHLLRLNRETLAMFQQSPLEGRLALAAPHDLGVSLVPGLLRRLAAVHPDVQVEVRLGTSDAVMQSAEEGSTNLALFNDVGPPRIPAQDLFSEPLKWLVLEGGSAVEKTPIPLAVAEIGCAWRKAALNALAATGRTYRLAYSSDTSMGQVAAVRADLAIAALPLSLADRDLVEAASHHDLPELPDTHIRIANDGSEVARALVEMIAAEMRAIPQC